MSTKMPRKRQPRKRGGNTGSRPVQTEDGNTSTNTQRRGETRGRTSKRTLHEVQTEDGNTSTNTQRRGGTRERSSKRTNSRPEPSRSRRPLATISLDVTFSSEDEDNLPLTPSPPPSTHDDLNYALTPSPPRSISNDISDVISTAENVSMNNAGENSESENDFMHSSPVSSPVPKKIKSDIPVYDGNSSSDDEDPFAIDYFATKKKAMENACRDFDLVEKEEKQKKKDEKNVLDGKKSEEIKLPSFIAEQPELEVIDEVLKSPDIEKEKKKHNDLFFSELGISPVDIISPSKQSVKMKRKTKKGLDQFQMLRASIFQERLKAKDDQDNDISIISDEEEDTNAEQTIRIRWGQETLKYTLRRLQKFLFIYQQLAETNGVSVSKVLLCHKDRIVSPESCPADLGVTVGDILEGGIQNSKESDGSHVTTNVDEESNPDSIELKVQNANNKSTKKIFVSKYDKMAVFMHKYAEEMGKTVKQFKFMFDGDVLRNNDSPESLDLDGGECIDVYEVL